MAQKCPIDGIFKPVVGKWKPNILYYLRAGPLRMSEIEDRIPEAHPRVLKRQVRSLEVDGILQKRSYGGVPPKVEYSLTEYGKDIVLVLDGIITNPATLNLLKNHGIMADVNYHGRHER